MAGSRAPRVGAEVGVLVDAGRDERMRDLEQERPRAGAQQEHRLAVERPRLADRGRTSRASVVRAVSIGARLPAHEGDAPDDGAAWGADFDPDDLARLETRMWKAYYRRQPARLFALLIEALHEQARVVVAADDRARACC